MDGRAGRKAAHRKKTTEKDQEDRERGAAGNVQLAWAGNAGEAKGEGAWRDHGQEPICQSPHLIRKVSVLF